MEAAWGFLGEVAYSGAEFWSVKCGWIKNKRTSDGHVLDFSNIVDGDASRYHERPHWPKDLITKNSTLAGNQVIL